MQKISTILKTFDPVEDKYISREFQAYGIYLQKPWGITRIRQSIYDLPKPFREQFWKKRFRL